MRRLLPGKLLPAFVFRHVRVRSGRERSPLRRLLNVAGLGKGTVALDGDWQFHWAMILTGHHPTLDDSGWERIGVDKPWGDQPTSATPVSPGIAAT